MMKNILIISFTLNTFICFTQVTLDELPEITIADFESIKCEIDTAAKAQIIYDIGNTYFWDNNDRIEHVFQKTTRLQILDKSGYDYGVIEIPFYVGGYGQEKIVDFKATSYNYEDGKIISESVTKRELLEDEINQWWSRKKYAFSKVKEGTIIEYSYKISSPYNFHLRTWFFQQDIPVVKSKYRINLCPFYNYIVLHTGFMHFDLDTVYTQPIGFRLLSKDYQTRVFEWELNNVPALNNEIFVPSADEYKMKVEFQLASYQGYYGGTTKLMSTWEKLIDELLEETDSFGRYIKSSKKQISKILDDLALDGKTDHEKVTEILQYVKDNYYWNKSNGLTATQSKKKFLDSKTGNVADINLFLHSLLKEAEIESSPIILSTRPHGKVAYQYPFLNLFNYVTVLVTDETGKYYIDATDPLLPMGMLPQACVNEYGLQIKKIEEGMEVQFFPLTPLKVDLTQLNQSFTINQLDQKVEGITKAKIGGYKALNFRQSIKRNGIESIYGNLLAQSQNEIIKIEVENLDKIDEPLVLKFTTKSNLEKIGDKVFLKPFPDNPYKENKLIKDSRVYPVDYGYLSEEHFFTSIAIPEEYEVDFIPEGSSFTNDELDLGFSYVIQKSNAFIQIMVKINRGKTIYEPTEYKELKAFYDMIVKRINENIVFKKI